MKTTRRQFMAIAATTVVVSGVTRSSCADPAPPGVVDPHFHIWDLKKFRLPWLDGAGPVLNRTFTMEDYRGAIAGLGVEKSVYVEVSVAPEQREAEAQFAIGVCDGKPISAVVAGARAGTDGFEGYVRKVSESGAVHGVRASIARGRVKDAKVVEDIRLLGKLGLSFDLLWDGANLEEAAELVEAAPQTRFILDHCGNASTKWFAPGVDAEAADRWRRGIESVAKHSNVACKISGVAENGPVEGATVERVGPAVEHCLERFGEERVMFASNWPVCLKSVTIQKWMEMLREMTAKRGAAYQQKLFHDNAAKWYRV